MPDFNLALNAQGALDGRKALWIALGSPLETLRLMPSFVTFFGAGSRFLPGIRVPSTGRLLLLASDTGTRMLPLGVEATADLELALGVVPAAHLLIQPGQRVVNLDVLRAYFQ